MANSAHMVFPLPVGAPTKTLSSLLYSALNTEENKNSLHLKSQSNIYSVMWMVYKDRYLGSGLG